MANEIIKGEDSPITFTFSFTGAFAENGLNNFTRIQVIVGDETYSSDDNPSQIVITVNTLTFDIGNETSLAVGDYEVIVKVFSAQFPNGTRLTDFCPGSLPPVTVIDPNSNAPDGVDPAVRSPYAYATINFVNSYHTLRGNSTWARCNADKLAAIVKATDYVEGKYKCRFPGTPTEDDQILHFPAENAYDRSGNELASDEVPLSVQNTVAELALVALVNGNLTANLTPSTNANQITQQRRQIGPLRTETRYATGVQTKTPSYPQAIAYLSDILIGSGSAVVRN